MSQEHIGGSAHGTYKSYITGFILSVILTVIPFWMVMNGEFAKSTIVVGIVIFAVVQILVHLVYFLHLNTSSEERWNVMAFVYTVIVIGVLVGGSLWIMIHLHYNMMIR